MLSFLSAACGLDIAARPEVKDVPISIGSTDEFIDYDGEISPFREIDINGDEVVFTDGEFFNAWRVQVLLENIEVVSGDTYEYATLSIPERAYYKHPKKATRDGYFYYANKVRITAPQESVGHWHDLVSNLRLFLEIKSSGPFIIPGDLLEEIQHFDDVYDINVTVRDFAIGYSGHAALEYGDFELMKNWLNALEDALQLVPKNTVKEFESVEFLSDVNMWYTGRAHDESRVSINTNPNPVHPFPYEYLSEDGYTIDEMLYVWLHEIGHLWHRKNIEEFQYEVLDVFEDTGVTKYVCNNYSPDTCVTRHYVNVPENFAESFSLYIVLPEYMKTHYPDEYGWLMNNIFENKEFDLDYNPPSSLRARLMKPLP
ncbi:MAG: hypothetical protein R3346_01570 [Candidatus Spechtbacterales bacterium]|nr:hypothetical protein [Candidatus Spechtbacterales bacterium]